MYSCYEISHFVSRVSSLCSYSQKITSSAPRLAAQPHLLAGSGQPVQDWAPGDLSCTPFLPWHQQLWVGACHHHHLCAHVLSTQNTNWGIHSDRPYPAYISPLTWESLSYQNTHKNKYRYCSWGMHSQLWPYTVASNSLLTICEQL